jgi:demethylmenaquinone methyltransferase/2-methoxy-6-polyprenyl-1,4-benzoquinol methylase
MNIEKLFDGIAFRYDLFNSISSFGIDKIWRHKLALLVKQPQNINLLDVAVGTGAVLLSIFEHKCDVNYTAGIDVSDKMLAIAEKKLAKLCRVGFSPRGSSSISLKRPMLFPFP